MVDPVITNVLNDVYTTSYCSAASLFQLWEAKRLLTLPHALDECARLTGCNCSAEWPFPVPHLWSASGCQGSPPPSPILWDWIAFDLCEKQWLKASHFSGVLIIYKKDLSTFCFHCGLAVIHNRPGRHDMCSVWIYVYTVYVCANSE